MEKSVFKLDLTKSAISSLQNWLNVIRVVVAVIIGLTVLILSWITQLNFDPLPILTTVIPIYFALVIFWFLISKKVTSLILLHVQLIIDSLAITAGIYLSGGINSELIFFYVAVLVPASLISFWSTILISVVNLSLYIPLAAWQPVLTGSGGEMAALASDDIIRIGIFSALAVMLAFQGYYLASSLRNKERELNKQKQEFLLQTVHDLRAPTNAIRLLASKYEDTTNLPPEAIEDAKLVHETSKKMLNLIKDLLSIGRGEKEGFASKKEPVDLRSVIQVFTTQLKPIADERNIKLNYLADSVLPSALGDKGGFEEVFKNLIDNAIKYNKDGGSVTINHTLDKESISTIIKDTGIGIAEGDIAKLFIPYSRVAGTKKEGSGLGLYFVKGLVEKMRGTIKSESKVGEGTTFIVTFPIAK